MSNQKSGVSLYGLDQISVGSGATRGFSKSAFSGESGYNITNDINIPLGLMFYDEVINGSVIIGLDIGKVKSISNNTDSGSYIGVQVGIRAFYPNGFTSELTISKPIRNPQNINDDPKISQFNLSYNY